MRFFQITKKRCLAAVFVLLLSLSFVGIGSTLAQYTSEHVLKDISLTIVAEDNTPPVLDVIAPTGLTPYNPTYVENGTYLVRGTVYDADTDVESVTVNGITAELDEDGNWSAEIPLDGSKVNTVTVVATDLKGNTATAQRYIKVLPILAKLDTWFSQGGTSAKRASITQIEIVDSYTLTGNETASWDASEGKVGSVTAYLEGTKLTIAGNGTGCVYTNPNSKWAFSGSGSDDFTKLTTFIGGDVLDTSMTWTMERMFENAYALATVDVSKWNTAGVQSMQAMFQNATSLGYLDVSNWNMSNIGTMAGFMNMTARLNTAMKTLDVSNWDLSNNRSLAGIFQGMAGLTELNVSKWDTSNTTAANLAFARCFGLTSLDVAPKAVVNSVGKNYEAWDMSNVTTVNGMFSCLSSSYGTMKLTDLNVTNWNMPLLTDASFCFYGCTEIESLDLSGWGPCNSLRTIEAMFQYCTSLKNVNFGEDWATPALTNASYLYNMCYSLLTADFDGWDFSKTTTMALMLSECLDLTSVDFGDSNTTSLTNITALCNRCTSLKSVDVSNFRTQNVTGFANAFADCRLLEEIIGLENWNTANGLSFKAMFQNCVNLKRLNLISFDTRKAADGASSSGSEVFEAMLNMFSGMVRLEEITLGEDYFFDGCGTNTSNAAILPTPSDVYIPGVTGLWYRISDWAEFAPADVPDNLAATYVVTPPMMKYPVLAESDTWFSQGGTSVTRASITEIEIVDSYTLTGNETASWDASAGKNGKVMAYVVGTKLIIAGDGTGCIYAHPNSKWAFSGSGSDDFSALTRIYGGELLDTSKVWTMERMFERASALTTVNTSNWDTSRVQSMKCMFQHARALAELDVSGWNTGSVTDLTAFMSMGSTATANTKLKTLAVDNWDLSNCTTIQNAFYHMAALETLNVSKWETTNIRIGTYAFGGCVSLTALDVGTKSVTNSAGRTYTAWNVGSLATATGMFMNMEKVARLDTSNWNIASLKDATSMFAKCYALEEISFRGGTANNLTTATTMAIDCINLKTADLSGWGECPVLSNAQSMFSGCSSLTSVDLSTWKPAALKTIKAMFQQCALLAEIAIGEQWTTPVLEDASYAFYGCTSMKEFDFSRWDFSKVTTISHMMSDCVTLESVNFSGINTPSLVNMDCFMNDCIALRSIDVSDFDTQNVKVFSQMFEHCAALEEITGLGNWNTSNGVTFTEMFMGCSSLKELDLSSFDTRKAVDGGYTGSEGTESYAAMESMFAASMTALRKVSFGVNFRFDGCGTNTTAAAVLPTPSADYIAGATGMWYRTSDWAEFTPASVPDTLAATYVAVPPIVQYPVLAEMDTWFSQGGTSVKRASITEIEIVDSYTLTGNETASWDASAGKNGKVMAYVVGTKLIIAGDGTGCVYAHPNSKWAFSGSGSDDFSALTRIYGGELLDTSKVWTMERMFERASALTTVNTSNWDTSRVQTMKCMFQHARALAELDVSGWNTGSVTDLTAFMSMGSTATANTKLRTLAVDNWDLSNCTTIQNAFYHMAALETLNVSKWETTNIRIGTYAFGGCVSLTALDVGTKSVTNSAGRTYTAWNVGNLATATGMFMNMEKVTALNVSGWNTASLSAGSYLFANCYLLTDLDVSQWTVTALKDASFMFANDYALPTLSLAGWSTPVLTNTADMFYMCGSIKELDLSNLNTTKVTNLHNMFAGMTALEKITLGVNFQFEGNGTGEAATLPTPSNEYIAGATGKWYRTSDGAEFAPADVPDGAAATFVAVPEAAAAEDIAISEDAFLATIGKGSCEDPVKKKEQNNGTSGI